MEWLIEYPGTDAAQASIDLAERLDRERRQACRKGALEMWVFARELAEDAIYTMSTKPQSTMVESLWSQCQTKLQACAAFRAAARAK